MSFVSMYFSYNGIRSEDMGIYAIKTSGGMIQQQYFGSRKLNYELVHGSNTPYYYSETIEPLQVNLQLSPLENKWTTSLKNEVTRWLNNGKFNEFYSTDDINRRYFLSYTGSSELEMTGNYEGWINVSFQNIDCYVRSPQYEKIFDLSGIGSTPTFIEVENLGSNPKLYPQLWIEKVGAGDLEIKNYNDGGRVFEFTNLENGEEIFVDNKNRFIESDVSDRSPTIYDTFNKNFLYWVYGKNNLKITGACKLKFKYRYEYLSS